MVLRRRLVSFVPSQPSQHKRDPGAARLTMYTNKLTYIHQKHIAPCTKPQPKMHITSANNFI